MKASEINDWLGVLTNVGLIVGLIFVGYGIQQNREAMEQSKALAEAQLLSEGYAKTANFDMTIAGENPAEVLAKVCELNEQLTIQDTIVLDYIYWSAFDEISRSKLIDDIADLERTPWLESVVVLTGLINTPHGRWWWEEARKGQEDAEIVRIIDETIDGFSPNEFCEYHLRFSNLKS